MVRGVRFMECVAFFKLREWNGENRKKKVKVGGDVEGVKKEEAEGEDFKDLILDGEEEGEVPIFRFLR
jgi:hypothetical protein